MSRKIILNEECKDEIINYLKTEYQCTISMVCEKFNISRQTLYNNLGKDYILELAFHGTRDETKIKIANTLTGRKQSEETKKKRKQSCKNYHENESQEHKDARIQKMLQTRALNAGSIENSYKIGAFKTKQTKLEKYSDSNYNNMDKNRKTKKDRYGDEHYNNKEKIRQTQFDKYGNYAFAVKEKYEKTMLEKYGVRHNWKSKDPKLNGWETRIDKFGSKENFYSYAQEKGRETRKLLYGNEFYSNTEKAQETMLEKYGVPFYTMTEDFQKKSHTIQTRQKAIDTKRKNHTFNTSTEENITYTYLCEQCGEENVFREYQDERYANSSGYKFKCDFYIKPLDLFIELNLFPTHGLHPFDANNKDDIESLNILVNNPTKWNKCVIDVWTRRDVEKLNIAKENHLNYLVIYDMDNYIEKIKERIYNDRTRV